jgi:hypothetical protein
MPTQIEPASMNVMLRLFARYAARVGYLDGKRNYPGAQHFLETPVFGATLADDLMARDATEALQVAEPTALKEQR